MSADQSSQRQRDGAASSSHAAPPLATVFEKWTFTPVCDLQTSRHLRDILADPSVPPVWSRRHERLFHQRSREYWLQSEREYNVEQAELKRMEQSGERYELGPSGQRRHTPQAWDLLERMTRRLGVEGLMLYHVRIDYWNFEIDCGVPPDVVLSRLAPFPEEYEPTRAERDEAERRAGFSGVRRSTMLPALRPEAEELPEFWLFDTPV
ncbi:hypothetical protein JCM10207_005237 [Rhodosporidiobolus poonsookiae]